ncbi:MAG: hypothetical protein V3V31_04655 [Methylococcales bacterium]
MSFPTEFPLNGIDHFLHQLDRILFQSSGKRNVCSFVVDLKGHLTAAFLNEQLCSHPTYRWITAFRLKPGRFFALARWRIDPSADYPRIYEHQISEFSATKEPPDSLLNPPINPERESPFRIDVITTATDRTLIIFSWHHALMDAHGAETFIQHLCSSESTEETAWVKNIKPRREQSLRDRLKMVRGMKVYLYDTSRLPFLSLFQPKPISPTLHHRVLRFNGVETQQIAETARQQGAGFLLSAFYLSATARAIAHIQSQRGPLQGDVLVPVPQDRRKRGAHESLVGNHVTFIFYRIPQAALNCIKECTMELVQQTTKLMRSEAPEGYLVMIGLIQRLPGWLYRPLLKSPTRGLMASFFYSDTGDSLGEFKTFLNKTITNAIHYPPNAYPPGVTFIFTRFQGALQITISYMEEVLDNEEIELLVQHLQSDLFS